MADLMLASLEGPDSANHEDPEKVVRAEFAIQEIIQNIVYKSEFWDGISRIVLEVQFH